MMANSTGGQSTLHQPLRELPRGMAEFFSGLNIFLSVSATLGNTLILIGLHKVSSIYPPTKVFFRCLAVTDLCVGLFVQPLYAINIMSKSHLPNMNMNVMDYVFDVREAIGLILCEVSLLTSTAISVDRLLALLLGLRYRHAVTLRRVRVVTIGFWLIGASSELMRTWKRDIAFTKVSVVIIISLISSIICYTTIHFKLRHRRVQVQDIVCRFPQGHPNGGGIVLNIPRYKKTVSSIMWIQVALVACYIPFVTACVLFVNGIQNNEAWKATSSLVYFNSSLNPILYCWKIPEVRQVVKDTIRQLYCFKFTQ